MPSQPDTLLGAGEVSWVGIALYLTDHMPRLLASVGGAPELSPAEREVLWRLQKSGASFFAPLHAALGGGFP